MIMHLDYSFDLDGKKYYGRGLDIGDTSDIEAEKKEIEQNKKAAICHEFDLTVDDDSEKIEELYKKAKFEYCELY